MWDMFTMIHSGVTTTSRVIHSRVCSVYLLLNSCCRSWTSSCTVINNLNRCRLHPRTTHTGDIRRVSRQAVTSRAVILLVWWQLTDSLLLSWCCFSV